VPKSSFLPVGSADAVGWHIRSFKLMLPGTDERSPVYASPQRRGCCAHGLKRKARAIVKPFALVKKSDFHSQGCAAVRPRAAEPRNTKPWSTSMKFRPLHDRVVVERIDPEAKSAGGIIIPDTAQEKPSQGEIIAVGPGGRDEAGKLIPIDLKKGDRVLFGKWSGTEVKLDGVDYLIMKESDIMGVIEETVAKKKAA
jgi:chaperonin GroES